MWVQVHTFRGCQYLHLLQNHLIWCHNISSTQWLLLKLFSKVPNWEKWLWTVLWQEYPYRTQATSSTDTHMKDPSSKNKDKYINESGVSLKLTPENVRKLVVGHSSWWARQTKQASFQVRPDRSCWFLTLLAYCLNLCMSFILQTPDFFLLCLMFCIVSH